MVPSAEHFQTRIRGIYNLEGTPRDGRTVLEITETQKKKRGNYQDMDVGKARRKVVDYLLENGGRRPADGDTVLILGVVEGGQLEQDLK